MKASKIIPVAVAESRALTDLAIRCQDAPAGPGREAIEAELIGRAIAFGMMAVAVREAKRARIGGMGPTETWAFEEDDLRQAASLGVLEAVRLFDRDRGCQFVTIAHHYVRKCVQECGVNLRYRVGSLRMIRRSLGLEGDSKAEIRARAAAACSGFARVIASLSEADDDPAGAAGTACPSVVDPPPRDDEANRLLADRLLEGLDDREAFVLRKRFGIGEPDGQRWTLHRVGESMGVCKDTVKTIERAAMRRVRRNYPCGLSTI